MFQDIQIDAGKVDSGLKWLKTHSERCIGCEKCMETCSTLWFRDDSHLLSRIRVSQDEKGYHINACNQCGKCIDICPVGALRKDASGVVQLDKNSCVGCMMCVGFCPSASLFFNISAGIEPFKCIACGACVKVCPTEAIEMIEG